MDARRLLLIWLLSFPESSAEGDANKTKIFLRREGKPPIFEGFSGGGLNQLIPAEEKTILRFILDFAVYYEWDQIVLFVPIKSAMLKPVAATIYEYFNGHGKYISIHSTQNPLLPMSLHHNRHRMGVALLCEPEMDDFIDELLKHDVFNEYQSWLFIRREAHKGMDIVKKLSNLSLGLDSNAVVCRLERHQVPTKPPKLATTTVEDDGQDYETGERICIPENKNENWYAEFCTTGAAARSKREIFGDPQVVITLHQIYKVSRYDNGSFVQSYLGFWDAANGLANSDVLVPVENRLFLQPFRIIIGVRNSSFEGGTALPANSFSTESDEDEVMHMKEVLECLLHGFNARREIIQFPKLGWRNEEGGWTHMLGAVVGGTIDFALDTINVNVDSLQEMYLTYPIVKTMNNIYFRRPDSGGMRDIFLAPFSPNLLISVLSTAILLAIAMISIALVNCRLTLEDKTKVIHKLEKVKEIRVGSSERKWEVSEAVLWSVSVMCMQGSPWHPSSKSGSLLLICGLLFALVIYNAYAAFITSVLSVKTVRIKNLEDLIHSNFAFGYTLGNTDELFLRTVNDSLLRELYFKGLRKNDGVNDPVVGMHCAGKGEYAFFVAARFARRALMRDVPHSQRCGIQELSLPITRTVGAIPVSRTSPYKKVINFRLLRMMEAGILHRFQVLILPPMPKCVERNTFNSARFTDVYSAFYMIVIGWIASTLLLIGEVLWHRRKTRHDRSRNHEGHVAFKDLSIVKSLRMHDFHWHGRMHN